MIEKNQGAKQKTLLVCLDNLGDLVFTSTIAMNLNHNPQVELGLWSKAYTSAIGSLMPGVKQVFAADPFWDKSPGRGRGLALPFFRTWLEIRRQKFTLALMPTTSWRVALCIWLAGIPVRVGYAGPKNQRWLTHSLPRPSSQEAVTKALLRCFAAYLPKIGPAHTYLQREKLPALTWGGLWQAKPLVCLHAFAGRMDRCAPRPILKSLALELDQLGYQVMWLGTAIELAELRAEDQSLAAEHCADYWVHSLLDLSWLIAQAKLFIGHDSGPLHVAGALGIPVLGFYLPGEPERTFPQGRAAAVMIARAKAEQLTLPLALEGLRKIILLIESDGGNGETLIRL